MKSSTLLLIAATALLCSSCTAKLRDRVATMERTAYGESNREMTVDLQDEAQIRQDVVSLKRRPTRMDQDIQTLIQQQQAILDALAVSGSDKESDANRIDENLSSTLREVEGRLTEQ